MNFFHIGFWAWLKSRLIINKGPDQLHSKYGCAKKQRNLVDRYAGLEFTEYLLTQWQLTYLGMTHNTLQRITW